MSEIMAITSTQKPEAVKTNECESILLTDAGNLLPGGKNPAEDAFVDGKEGARGWAVCSGVAA